MLWDWGDEEVRDASQLSKIRAFKISMHRHPVLGEVARVLAGGDGRWDDGIDQVKLRFDFARIEGVIKLVATWELCRDCFGTGFVDGCGTKAEPGFHPTGAVCSWEDEDVAPDEPPRRCYGGFVPYGGLLIPDCGAPVEVRKLDAPAGWLHQGVYEAP